MKLSTRPIIMHGEETEMSVKLILAVVAAASLSSAANGEVYVYGPGGPGPAMKEAAAVYSRATGEKVIVTAGPDSEWLGKAKQDADLIFSGSESMMTKFVRSMDGQILSSEVKPLYLRESAILVRKGNPKRIRGIRDLLRPGTKVMVVEGAGQDGLWEDIAGRTGDIRMVRGLRSNIVAFAENSGKARQRWIDDPGIDAWIIWTIWQKANPTLADQVRVEPHLTIFRDTGVVLTARGKADPEAGRFARWLAGPQAASIFAKWGWITPRRPR